MSVDLLLDATRTEIISAIEELSSQARPRDNLLIYFLGRGFVDPTSTEGLWLPSGAGSETRGQWISNLEVADILLDTPAKRCLIISEPHFSTVGGSPTGWVVDVEAKRPEPSERLSRRAQLVLTSSRDRPQDLGSQINEHSFSIELLELLKSSNAALGIQTIVNTLGESKPEAPPLLYQLDADEGGVFTLFPGGTNSSENTIVLYAPPLAARLSSS